MATGAADSFTPTLVPDVGAHIDETGAPLEPVGPKLLFLKVAAIGAAALAEFVFMKWQNCRRETQRQQQRQQQ